MKLILLGAPGAGKGTQAEIISEKYNIPTISTGNIIRAALKNGTEMGLKAKSYIDAGELVPDNVVIGIIKERLSEADCKEGYILDGFPRTIPQAVALDDMGFVIDAALSIEVDDSEIVKRMSGRRVCEKCGASYHTEYKKPEVQGVCNLCGGNLVIRKDDEPETVKNRLNVYHEQTEPLKDFYKGCGKLIIVEGQDKVEDTTRLVLEALENQV
ncbi:MAG: adenylate kinase [Acutalibacteraceae bacterium]